MSKKHKKLYTALNYIEPLGILASVVTRWALFSAFAPSVGIPIDILTSSVALKMYAITAGTKAYKSIIKKR